MESPMTLSHLTLGDLERSKWRSLKAGLSRPLGGGGERGTDWVVVCRPRLVRTVGKCKPTPPKHAHMFFLWWHSIQRVRRSSLGSWNNTQIRDSYKLFSWAFVIVAFSREFVCWWWSFHFLRQDWYNGHTSQSTSISRLLLLCSQNPVQVSWVKTANVTLYIYSRPLRCRHGGGRGEKYMWLISLKLGAPPPIKTRSLAGHKNAVWPYLDWLGLGFYTLGLTAISLLKFENFKMDWTSVSKYQPCVWRDATKFARQKVYG